MVYPNRKITLVTARRQMSLWMVCCPEDKISDSTQANAFMDGLLPSIQQLADMQESTTMKSAIDQALRAERSVH